MTRKDLPKERKWVLRDGSGDDASAIDSISKQLELSRPVAQLLYGRGYDNAQKARSFIEMKEEILEDPFLLKDIEPAVNRILTAVEKHEKILIYGDYDVDGVTSVCTFFLYLESIGADVSYFIPTRSSEGHGVSLAAIDSFKTQGIGLIITVDTGITASDEVEYAKKIGIDFVITDHHECHTELPDAVAVVNPHRPDCPYPFKDLAGVGVVLKVVCATEETRTKDSRLECVRRICREYADLVAIGTIADVMPICGENKLIVASGLSMVAHTRRIGLLELMKQSSAKSSARKSSDDDGVFVIPKITSGYIGYTIAPRINAAGRLRSASIAVELFLTKDEEVARELAKILCDANRERQSEENRISEEAFEYIDEFHDFEKEPMIVLESDTWHHGVIGIVASRITERYGVPCVLISFDTSDSDRKSPDDIGKGSGRSIKGFNLVDALCSAADILPKFGGHELAAGLSVRRADVPRLRMMVCDYAAKKLKECDTAFSMEADLELSPEDIHMKLVQDLSKLEPYGPGNTVPVFACFDLEIKDIIPVTGGKHTKLILGYKNLVYTAMCFSASPASLNLFRGERCDVLFNLDINEYYGKKSIQMIVKDIRRSSALELQEKREHVRFFEIYSGGAFSAEEDVLPTRNDFAAVYLLVKNHVRAGVETLTHRAILLKLAYEYKGSINYIKLKFIIRILQEMNVLGIDEICDEMYHFKLNFKDEKTDLEKSNILRRLRSQQP